MNDWTPVSIAEWKALGGYQGSYYAYSVGAYKSFASESFRIIGIRRDGSRDLVGSASMPRATDRAERSVCTLLMFQP